MSLQKSEVKQLHFYEKLTLCVLQTISEAWYEADQGAPSNIF